MSSQHVLDEIQQMGKKLTVTRREMVAIFYERHNLLSAPEVLEKLAKAGIEVNKTTVYRELDFLLEKGFLKTVVIEPGVTHYESTQHGHHHHLTCLDCGEIMAIKTRELKNAMRRLQRRLGREGWAISDHTLEFTGTCKACN